MVQAWVKGVFAMKRVQSFLGKHKAELNNVGILLLFVVLHVAFVLKYGVGIWEQVWQAGPGWVTLVVVCGLAAGIIRSKWPTPGLLWILVHPGLNKISV